jgi:heme A synthase
VQPQTTETEPERAEAMVEEMVLVRPAGALQLTAIAVLTLGIIALVLEKNLVATVLFVIAAALFLATIFLQRRR